MSFSNLQAEILAEAKRRAAAVRDEIEKQIHAEEARITKRATALEEQVILEAEREGQRQARRLHQSTALTGKAAVLSAKQAELTAAKEDVKNHLLALSEKEAEEMLQALLQLIPDTEGVITPGEHHAASLRKLADKKFTVGKDTIPKEGGFIYRSSDTELNVTISHLVDQLFIKHRAAIAAELFS